MKWRAKQTGDKRTVKRFALFPKRLDNKYRIWLEFYYNDQIVTYCTDGFGIESYYWQTIKSYQKEATHEL